MKATLEFIFEGARLVHRTILIHMKTHRKYTGYLTLHRRGGNKTDMPTEKLEKRRLKQAIIEIPKPKNSNIFDYLEWPISSHNTLTSISETTAP